MSEYSVTSGISVSTNGSGAISNASNERTATSDLDKEAFLKLLMTQLQYQDPLEPMDNTAFVSQMAQFTALEQMQNLNTTMTNSQAFSLIGKGVQAVTLDTNTNTYTEIAGIVSSVTVISGTPYLVVGDQLLSYSDVQQVFDVTQSSGLESSVVVSQALALIGKNIQAIMLDEDLNAKEYVEGTVDYVKFVDGVPILSVNGKEVYTYEVISVSDENLLIGKTVDYIVEGEKTSGSISNIIIKDDALYLEVGEDKAQVEIQDINSLISSYALVGQEVSAGDISGKVTGVIIKDKVPYLVVGDNYINYKEID